MYAVARQIYAHCIVKSMLTPNHHTHVIVTSDSKTMSITMEFNPFFAGIIARILDNPKFWSMKVGICPFSHKSISEVRYYCWVRRLGVQLALRFTPKVLSEKNISDLARHLISLAPSIVNHVLTNLTWCIVALSCWTPYAWTP